MLRTATVNFLYGNTRDGYDFITDIQELTVGDVVVVESSLGLGLATVVAVCDEVTAKAKKWIVCKVDMEAHNKRMAKTEELKQLKAKMEARRKQLQDIQVYAILADNDSKMAELLKEYRAAVQS
jgi:hypothetical protein